jgi:hemoglobin
MMEASLYEKIGGEPAIRVAVIKLYSALLTDDDLKPFFEDIDVARLRSSQAAFITMALGGPHHYTGQNMRNAHRRLVQKGLTDLHFDKVKLHLSHVLAELGVKADLIEQALRIVETTRADVLNRSQKVDS